MRFLLLLCALAMPAVSWFSQKGDFGPTNGAVSDRYPTLIVAAGYAFAVWGLIFLLDVVFGIWQTRGRQRHDMTISRIRPAAAAGFALTAAWMPIFSQQLFWLSLIVIWAALACLLYCAAVLSRDDKVLPGQNAWAWCPLSLHAGWLSVAVFLNTAQVIVAYKLLPVDDMLPWTLGLFGAAAILLLAANARMRGNVAYVLVVLWGLYAVHVKQMASALPGATIAAWAAIVLALVLAVQTLRLRALLRKRRDRRSRSR